jgi:hypothetical protein
MKFDREDVGIGRDVYKKRCNACSWICIIIICALVICLHMHTPTKTLSFSQYVLAQLWQEGFCRFYELTRWANVLIKVLMFQISTYFETWTWNNISTCSLAIFSTTRLTAFCRSTSAGNPMENMPKFAQTDWGVARGAWGGRGSKDIRAV